jgi:hypothetical protein
MVKTLSVNSSVSLNELIGSGDVSISFFGRQTFSANDAKFVFTKTRNFGTTLYTPVGFSSNFWAQLGLDQSPTNHLQGEALHTALTSALGTHYVRGYDSAAMVSVVFTFHHDSASIKQQLSISASGSSFDTASFSSYVSAFFQSTNTDTTLTYQFYSSDPGQSPTNFSFGLTGSLGSYQDFTNFVSRLETYANAMDPARAKVTAYILDPIQTVPGYLALLGGYVPPPTLSPDYTEFLEYYTALQTWNQRLTSRGAMSWLNARGQQVISNTVVDVRNYLSSMQSISSNHFNHGAPLYVPRDVVAYLASLRDLRLPTIYVMDTWQWYDGTTYTYHTVIGRLDCGNSDLVATLPFGNIALTNSSGTTTLPLYYIPSDFQTNMLKTYSSGTRNAHLKALFASEQWNSLTNSNPNLNGFFMVTERNNVAAEYSLAIYDPISGAAIDSLPLLATQSGGCESPGGLSNLVSVTVATVSAPVTAVAGVALPVTLQVTNQGTAQAYGTTVSFVLSNGFDFGGGSSSQGSASFNTNSRVVTCSVGPLAGGAGAEINVQLIPMLTGSATPASSPVLGFSPGLTNAATSNAVFASIQSTPPAVSLVPVPGGVLLDWWADTDRMQLEISPVLGAAASWTPRVTGVVNGSHRFLFQPAAPQGYFRLHGR